MRDFLEVMRKGKVSLYMVENWNEPQRECLPVGSRIDMLGACCDHKGHCNDHNNLMKGFHVLQRLDDSYSHHQSIDLPHRGHECSWNVMNPKRKKQSRLK